MSKTKQKANKSIVDILSAIDMQLKEVANLIQEVEVSEKVGGDYQVTPEFEEIVSFVHNIRESAGLITDKNPKNNGSLDELEEQVKEQLKTFFKSQYKQKKYEGSLMEMGYRVTARKSFDENVISDDFVKTKKALDTQKVNAYIKATKTDEHPDGKLPEGVSVTEFEYVTYKPVINE